MFKNIFHIDQLVGLALLVLLLLLSHIDPYPIEYVREKCFDAYQTLKPRVPPSPEQRLVVIVDVDEKSLKELGQWPWSRKTIATLVADLHNMGAGVIAFDIVFPEADRLNPASLLDILENVDDGVRDAISGMESNDEIFARVLEQTNVVLGRAGFWGRHQNDSRVLMNQTIAVRNLSSVMSKPTEFLVEVPTLIGNLPLLEENAKGVGTFAFKPILDDIVRKVPMVNQHKGNLYPSLVVEAVRVGLQVPTVMLEVGSDGISAVAIAPARVVEPDGLKIITDKNGQVRPYFSSHDPRIYVSASDVLKQRINPDKVAGKIVFIGSSAVGLQDIRSTPVSSQIPGVEIHTQIVENMLAIDPDTGGIFAVNQFLTRPKFVSKGGEIVLIAIGGLMMIILTPILGARRSLAVFLVLSCGAIVGSWYLFVVKHVLLDATFAVITAFLLYSTLTYLSLTREEAAKRHIRKAFGKYLSPAMVDLVAKHPEQLKLGGQKRDMTLLFCDVRGFTAISEQLSAEGLTKLINRLLSPLTNVILNNGGTVDKYMGDCIMAFWNAPLDDPLHARNGCLAALRMLEEMELLNKRLLLESKNKNGTYMELKVGLGLNSGECVVGNMGSAQRFDYSVLGDTVNLASRLEGQSKNYGVQIVIGEGTHRQVPMLATFELDLIRVKGKAEAVRIFALAGDEEVAQSSEFQCFAKAVDSMLLKWRNLDWDGAQTACNKARKLGAGYNVECFFDFYAQRICEFKAHPPDENWDGIFVATTK